MNQITPLGKGQTEPQANVVTFAFLLGRRGIHNKGARLAYPLGSRSQAEWPTVYYGDRGQPTMSPLRLLRSCPVPTT